MATETLQGLLGNKKKVGKFQSVPRQAATDPTIDAIAENIEQLTGLRGTGGKKAVLWEDLEALGVANFNNGLPQLGGGLGFGDSTGGGITPDGDRGIEPPTQPQNVVGRGGFGSAILTWDQAPYVGHSFAEIFQGTTNVFADAVRIGTTPADIFSVAVPFDAGYYFWVRFVNVLGDIGPVHSGTGTYVESVPDTDYLLGLIRSEIPDLDDYVTNDDLVDLVTRSELVDYADVNLLDRLEKMLAEASLESNVTIDEQVSELRTDGATLRATIRQEYYTAVTTDEAIAAANLLLKSEIEDEDGSSLAATIKQNYVTSTTFTEAQAQLKTELQSQIDDAAASLTEDYYTIAETDLALAQAKSALQSNIDGVSSNLAQNYLTKTETNEAIAQATTTLRSDIDDLNAEIHQDFYTSTQTDSAISTAVSQLETSLQSNINSLSSTLNTLYYTKTQTDGQISTAISAIETTLNSAIDDVEANLTQNYYTKTATDSQISSSTSQLNTTLRSVISAGDSALDGKINSTNSTVSSLSSNLSTNYYTKTQTDGAVSSAVASASSSLQSSINGVSSTVTTLSRTVADNQGEYEALWGVKTSVGSLNASVGLVANRSGAGIEDATFYVNNANFQVTYQDGNSTKTTPIFGTVVHNGTRYLAIETAQIKVANINDLVVGDIVANSVVAGSTIRSPLIQTPVINDSNSNFYVTAAGIVTMKGFNAHNGTIHNRLTMSASTSTYIDGRSSQHFINASSNFYVTHSGYIYAKNGRFEGEIMADKIVGDIVSAIRKDIVNRTSTATVNRNVWVNILDVTVANPRNYPRTLVLRNLDSTHITAQLNIATAGSSTEVADMDWRLIDSSGNVYWSKTGLRVSWSGTGGNRWTNTSVYTPTAIIPANRSASKLTLQVRCTTRNLSQIRTGLNASTNTQFHEQFMAQLFQDSGELS